MVKIKHNPVERYLMGLSSKESRVTMRSYLSTMVTIARPDEDLGLERFDTSKMCLDELATIKNHLQEIGQAPSTINTSLAAYKGVAKEAWKDGLLSVDDYQRIKEIPRIRASRLPKGRALELDELNQLIDHCMQVYPVSPMWTN